MSRAACRWKSERQAKKSVVRAKCDIVVDVRIEAAGDSGDQIQELDLKRCHWVAKACQRTKIVYLYASSSRVFSGQLDRPYTEEDYPDNEETVGLLLASAEQLVRDSCERHLILRMGPIFSHEGTNLITQMLGPMGRGGSLMLDNNLRGCPVTADDGARVVSALIDQLSTGVEPWVSITTAVLIPPLITSSPKRCSHLPPSFPSSAPRRCNWSASRTAWRHSTGH
jgi:dTDP-4-dehydrorhamnose reductase